MVRLGRSYPVQRIWSKQRRTVPASQAVILGTPTAATYVGSGNLSVALPTHAVGNLILIFAWDNSTNQPVKPTAGGTVPDWGTAIDTGAGTVSSGVYGFIASANNHTSGTWTSTIEMAAVVVGGQKATSYIGGHGATETSASTTNVPAPGVTLTKTDGSSLLISFFGVYSPSADWGAAPAGYTKQASGWSSGGAGVCVDSKNSSVSSAAILHPIANALGWGRGNTVEVLAA